MKLDTNRVLIEASIRKALRDMESAPERSCRNLIDLGLSFTKGRFQESFLRTAQEMLNHENSAYYALIKDTAGTVSRMRLHDLLAPHYLRCRPAYHLAYQQYRPLRPARRRRREIHVLCLPGMYVAVPRCDGLCHGNHAGMGYLWRMDCHGAGMGYPRRYLFDSKTRDQVVRAQAHLTVSFRFIHSKQQRGLPLLFYFSRRRAIRAAAGLLDSFEVLSLPLGALLGYYVVRRKSERSVLWP